MKNKQSSKGETPPEIGKPRPIGNQRQVSDAVGRRLRALYDDALNEPVPSDLSKLVERLLEKTDGSDRDDER